MAAITFNGTTIEVSEAQAKLFTEASDESKATLFGLFTDMASMRKAVASKLTLKVSDKGAVSLYGMGRWPVTLYGNQWEKLLSPVVTKGILDFINENRSKLSVKSEG